MKKLFLLDSMALLYRAHFALIKKPIFNSAGVNTSALYGYANVVLDLLEKQGATHLGGVFDTSAPTPRHEWFPAYKAQRDEMPEDLAKAIPAAKQFLRAMNIPTIQLDGYEADDLIGTYAKLAHDQGDYEVFMVTPDKDFGQLVTERVYIYKPGRQGSDTEILGVKEICERWGVSHPSQVIDLLGLMGDVSDNIPGIPGVGEKTAAKLIAEFGDVETLLSKVDQVKGKLQEKIRAGAESAILSKKLATIICDAPIATPLENLVIQKHDESALKEVLIEFEFNALGRRLLGEDFKAGRGAQRKVAQKLPTDDLFAASETPEVETVEDAASEVADSGLKTSLQVEHRYELVTTAEQRKAWFEKIQQAPRFCFDTETDGLNPLDAKLLGIAFSVQAHEACYMAIPLDDLENYPVIQEFQAFFRGLEQEKIGHNLKFDLRVLASHGIEVKGPFFDTMLAHALIDPEQRHGMDYLSERYLGYTPISITTLIGDKKGSTPQLKMSQVALDQVAEYASEDADVTLQLSEKLRPQLDELGLRKVFYEIEAPLLPVLAKMEQRGVKVNVSTLQSIGKELHQLIDTLQTRIQGYVDRPFNLNSPKQLGEVLFEDLALSSKPKKTATGQYQTNEQTLLSLQGKHPMIDDILRYRESTKLKNTYVDALPNAIHPKTGRIHTTFHQLMAATGRMASSDPNLQNIPIRSDEGRQIRKAFVPEGENWVLMSADYSQVELRVMASISGDEAMIGAFNQELDIHQATAAKVFGVELADVTSEMRRTAKMVNFGIIYGISAFGLSQRLGNVSRVESAQIIESYFRQYPGVKAYMENIVEEARQQGFVETLAGRRRYMRDLQSSSAVTRNAAERVTMNAPIQGTAADMIKLAMVRVEEALKQGNFKTRMLLQIHDELLFEAPQEEVESVKPVIMEAMRDALALKVPVLVEVGIGENWLAAH